MGLELYSKVEELFLDKEAAHILWGYFLEILQDIEPKNVLDIGCGSGEFCKMAKEFNVKGIDLSSLQVKKARQKGCNCEVKNVCELNEHFDASVAIFDVINYMDKKELKIFFECVKKVSDYFVFDINTKYAMEELAVGTLKAESDDKFGVLHSEFEDNKLITEIVLFKRDGECYKKEKSQIIQYYHHIDEIIEISGMNLVRLLPVTLYGSDEAEKLIVGLRI
ncbi:MAG: class I SAM-dependent methyltransferase [Epsilonproteobacteria bacterium]|nr:class I SAM-dependent methyltransferase [Campylobacterota bacterium]